MIDHCESIHYIELEFDCNDPFIWLDDDGEVTDEQHSGPYDGGYAKSAYCGFDDFESYDRACENAQETANRYGVAVTLTSILTECDADGNALRETRYTRNSFRPEAIDEEEEE